ncbi:MAG TPA: TIGR02265 family protein [bacterium]
METKVSGLVLLARKAFVKGHFGEAAWDRVLDGLFEEDQAFFRGLLIHAGWYPFEIGERLDKAIVDVLGGGNPKVFEEIGAKSARENLSGVHHSFLTPGNPQAFLAQSKMVYKFYYNTGVRRYESTGPNSGVLITEGAETFSTADCLTVVGWYKEALGMCGAKKVSVKETACRARGNPVCRYELRWEM